MALGNTLAAPSKCEAPSFSGNIKCEINKDSHQESVSTPRTEASTPESGEYTTFSLCDSDKKVGVEDSPGDTVVVERRLQRHMSQTDDHIQLLDRNGDLNEVAGSQSMLSQELIDHQHDENEDLELPESSQSSSSMGMAKRIGLLSQSQEELTQTQEEEEEPTKNQEPLSGLDLLTQVGIKEADKFKSFSAIIKSNATEEIGKGKDTSTKPDPCRDYEGFGSLLEAVAKITEQEASQEYAMNWPGKEASQPPSPASPAAESKKPVKKRKISRSLPLQKNPPAKQRKSDTQKKKERLRRERIEKETERAHEIAKTAAKIAAQTIADPVIAKKLLLSMALARENPRTIPQKLPGKGHVVPEGFFWAHYPPLEIVLKKHMAEYYELSTNQCQSRQQQAFNNYMVDVVKDVAEKQQWEFADSFCDKSLRDRIRCYYKTHIQNAKKRLRTMVRNPTKRANARHLCEHIELIEKHSIQEAQDKAESTPDETTETEQTETQTEN